MAKKLKISRNNYDSFCRINILVFFPSLIKYTKFEPDNNKSKLGNEEYLEMKSEWSIHDKKDSSAVANRKDYSKSNVKIAIPEEFVELQEVYEEIKYKDENKVDSPATIFAAIC